MNTFKWTVPEPRRHDPDLMNPDALAYWSRVRARGVEWYVVSKGLLFLVTYPLLIELVSTGTAGFEIRALMEGWIVGLASGYLVWLRREQRYERTLEAGGRPPE